MDRSTRNPQALTLLLSEFDRAADEAMADEFADVGDEALREVVLVVERHRVGAESPWVAPELMRTLRENLRRQWTYGD